MNFLKKQYLYIIIVLVILAITTIGWYCFSSVGRMRCGPCGCFNDECGDTSNSCLDSDRGIAPNIQGRVSGYKNNLYYIYLDACANTYNVTEYYCSSTNALYRAVSCVTPTTTNCENGACVCKCSDGTYCNSCSSNKPKYCSSGTLIDKCSQCGCPSSTPVCNADDTCSIQNFNFSMSATPSSATVYLNSSTESRIKIDLTAGTTKNVDLSVSGCPPNTTTCNLFSTSPPPVVTLNGYPTFETLLQIVPSPTTTPGTYTVTVTGTGEGLTRTTSFNVNIITCTCENWVSGNCGGSCDYTQRMMTRTCNPAGCNIESSCMASSSCATGFNITATPQSSSVHKGGNITYLLTLNSINGWTGTVDLDTIGCPTGVGCQFSLDPIIVPQASSNTSTLKIIATSGSTVGSYPIIVKGYNIGGPSANTTVNLEILP